MCLERLRSLIIAIAIGLSMGLVATSMQYAFIALLLVIIALLVDGFTGFCPIRAVLKNVVPPCEKN